MKLMVFAILIGAIFLFGCITPPPSNLTNNTPPIMTIPNSTQGPAQNATQNMSALPPDHTVDLGDNVSVIYALYVDGKLYDTNNATLANESGMYNPARTYAPLNFTAELNKGMINGFVINIIGMKVNESLAFSVDPARGYGPYDPKKVITVARYYNMSLKETVPRSYFTERGINVTNGTSFNSQYGMVFIEDFNDDNVTIFYPSLLSPGYEFKINNVPNRVVDSINYYSYIERTFEVNKTYVIPNPSTGMTTKYLVLDKSDQNITLDANHPLANKTLLFKVRMLDIQRGK